jgi:hypothetical protein
MPRCFFHLKDGRDYPDDVGTELPDVQAAQTEAVKTSGELLRDLGHNFWDNGDWKLVVTDDRQKPLFTLRFSAEDHRP